MAGVAQRTSQTMHGHGSRAKRMRSCRRGSLVAAVVTTLLGGHFAGVVQAALRSVPDPTWQTDGRVRAIEYSQGVVYIGGSFRYVRPPGGTTGAVARNHVAAFNAKTGQLLPWNPNANGTVWSLAASGSRIYLGGSFTTVRGRARAHVAAVGTARGGLKRWNPGANGTIHAIARDSNGRLYLGGTFTSVGGRKRLHVARVGPRGGVQAWKADITQASGSCPPSCPPIVFALALSRNESTLYIGGRFEFVNGVARRSAGAVSTATGTTRAWNPTIISPHPRNAAQVGRVLDMAISSRRAYLCGDFWSADGVVSANLVAVELVSGDRDSSFNANTDGGSPACELRNGFLYVGGHFGQVGPTNGWVFVPGHKATLTGSGTSTRIHIVAFDAETGAISGWNPGANSTLGVHALARGSRRLGVGGDFTRIGGVAQQSFAQFSAASKASTLKR
jgi:hypothetical protein